MRRSRKIGTSLAAGGMIAVMVGLVAYSPTIYQIFCAVTGYGGTVQRAVEPEAADAKPASPEDATAERTVRVHFDSNVAPGLDWAFWPEQREVETTFGEPTKVYYRARNRTDATVVARATFNVTPFKAAPYFFKIECFCFTEEKLGPGESARMPLVLYLDQQMLEDSNAAEVRDVTLSYTFFEQDDLSREELQAARDLNSASDKLDAKLERTGSAEFDNDAPRR